MIITHGTGIRARRTPSRRLAWTCVALTLLALASPEPTAAQSTSAESGIAGARDIHLDAAFLVRDSGPHLSSTFHSAPGIGDIAPIRQWQPPPSAVDVAQKADDDADEPVDIPDPLLRAEIERVLGKTAGSSITRGELSSLTVFSTYEVAVANLTGLEWATNLEELYIYDGSISDLEPLKDLDKLAILALQHNTISDIAPLAELTSLTQVALSFNEVTDISALAGLTTLEVLSAERNRISDLSSLGGLTGLTQLGLRGNEVSDISSLSNLTHLVWLLLGENPIGNIEPLASLTNLQLLHLDKTSTSNLTPLEGLTDVIVLSVGDNAITSVNALEGLTGLQNLIISSNSISDISPLENLSNLTRLVAYENMIAEISALASIPFPWYGEEKLLDLRHNPLNAQATEAVIPALEKRGVVAYTEDDHGDRIEAATDLAFRTIGRGEIRPYYEADYFRMDIAEPVEVRIFTTSGYLDTTGVLLDQAGNELAVNDNDGEDFDFEIVQRLEPGVYYIGVRTNRLGLNHDGGRYLINAVDAEEVEVDIPDAVLRAALESKMSKRRNEPITSVELAKLQVLDAQAQGITDLSGLEHATNLIGLRLNDNAITTLAPLANATQMEYLELNANSISDLAPLSAMHRLSTLRLGSNSISDLSPLSGLTRLSGLHLSDNAIGDLSPLAGLSGLHELNLSSNSISDISHLSRMSRLEDLLLAENSITDIGSLAELTGLYLLDLSSNEITDIAPLSGLTALNDLNLASNSISDITPLAGLARLYSLHLASNSISDITPLAGLARLNSLNLSFNSIFDITPLAGLHRLTELRLQSNRITDISPLTDLGSLYVLDLGSNSISDIGPVANLTRLHRLYLHDNRISDIAPLVRNDGLGRGAEVSLHFNPLAHRSLAEHLPVLAEREVTVSLEDDHGQGLNSATELNLGNAAKGLISTLDDIDIFRLEVAETAQVRVFTTGAPNAFGRLLNSEGVPVDADARHGIPHYYPDGNRTEHMIVRSLDPGEYYVTVRSKTLGAYIVHALESRANRFHVPLFLAASDPAGQGFVRIINHGAESGEARVHAVDDSGWMTEPLTISFDPGQTRHFNSDDLESGNAEKALRGSAGRGRGDWRLEFESDLDLEVLAYVRTRDGFLTSMHDVAPFRKGIHRVATLNPGSNERQVSQLRLVNTEPFETQAFITGTDDQGQGGHYTVRVPKHSARTLNALQLELRDEAERTGLGDGEGKWRLAVDFLPLPVAVMSLMRSPTGHLTNLSSWPETPWDGRHRIRLFPPADDDANRQGFARIINLSNQAGEVTIHATDDFGIDYEPIRISLEPEQTVHFNSMELEAGNPEKGLSHGIGPGVGDWRLVLSSDLDIAVLAYIRTADGFLTSMNAAAPGSDNGIRIVTFNPASNVRQVSHLRLINLDDEPAAVTVRGIDDSGAASGSEVRLFVAPGATSTISAEQLENGHESLEGTLGDGKGKWRLMVSSDRPIEAMSLLESQSGHLTNLSTAPGPGDSTQPK